MINLHIHMYIYSYIQEIQSFFIVLCSLLRAKRLIKEGYDTVPSFKKVIVLLKGTQGNLDYILSI
jgi:hypothetical protein